MGAHSRGAASLCTGSGSSSQAQASPSSRKSPGSPASPGRACSQGGTQATHISPEVGPGPLARQPQRRCGPHVWGHRDKAQVCSATARTGEAQTPHSSSSGRRVRQGSPPGLQQANCGQSMKATLFSPPASCPWALLPGCLGTWRQISGIWCSPRAPAQPTPPPGARLTLCDGLHNALWARGPHEQVPVQQSCTWPVLSHSPLQGALQSQAGKPHPCPEEHALLWGHQAGMEPRQSPTRCPRCLLVSTAPLAPLTGRVPEAMSVIVDVTGGRATAKM